MEIKTLASAFSGIGGFEIGLAGLGYKAIWACDIDPHAVQTYVSNFGVNVSEDLQSMPENVDMFTAGFPCSPFSVAGKRDPSSHPAGNLWRVTAGLIVQKSPKNFILENVPQFLKSDNWQIMQDYFDCNGIKLYYHVVNGIDLGIPQRRKRVFITNFPWTPPKKVHASMEPSMWRALVNPKGRQYYEPYRNIEGRLDGKRGQGYRIYSTNDPAPSISRRMRLLVTDLEGNIFQPSVREYYNLFGFPQRFKIHPSKTHALNQIGNSLIPAAVSHIGGQRA